MFLVCVLISTLYWIVTILGNTYETNMNIEVTYQNQPKNKIILSELPNDINAHISGSGYSLLFYSLGLVTPEVKIDLSKIQMNKSESSSTVNYSNFKQSIEAQLGSRIHLLSLTPSNIEIITDNITEKLVKIEPVFEFSDNKQFQLSELIQIEPQKIKISGPKSIVDTIQEIPTELVRIQNNQPAKEIEVKIDPIFMKSKKLMTEDPSIKIRAKIDKYTEYTLKVPVMITNIPNDIEISVFPNQVEIKFMISIGKLSMLKKEDFLVLVDCSELNIQYKKLKVNIEKYPPFVTSISINPAKVEYVLRKKDR